jgi:RNA polymerase sigma factor (sigma-70 family)
MNVSNRQKVDREQFRAYWRAACVEYYAPLLKIACRRAGGRLHEAEDNVQETFYRALKYPKNPADVRNPLGFLQRIMRNVRIAKWAKEQITLTDSLEEILGDPARQKDHPAVELGVMRTIENEERMEDLRIKMGPLNQNEKLLLELFLKDQSFEEIAETLEKDVCRIKTEWHALITKLRYRIQTRSVKTKKPDRI